MVSSLSKMTLHLKEKITCNLTNYPTSQVEIRKEALGTIVVIISNFLCVNFYLS